MIIILGRVHFTVLIYFILLASILFWKPALMFDAEGRPKTFGVQTTSTTTPFAPVFVLPLLAIILYFVVSVLALARA